MNLKNIILSILFFEFLALTVYAVLHGGSLTEIFTWLGSNPWGWQIGVDLAVAVSFGMTWIWRDSKVKQLNPYPYLILCIVLGSVGLFAYALRRRLGTAALL